MVEKPKRSFLVFREKAVNRKTRMWEVLSAHNSSYLGTIHFWPQWRHYILAPLDGTIWSGACLQEAAEFCLARTKEWRKGARR